MALINGIHHIALKPTKEQYPAVVKFYTELLELQVIHQWGDPEMPCLMVCTGDNSRIEVLPQKEGELPNEGKFAHLALATTEVDECIRRVREAGYTVTTEPCDVNLGDKPARIAFCTGAADEIVEFFWEK